MDGLVQKAADFFQSDRMLQTGGHPAARWLQSGLSTNVLRTNALLRKHEWERIDAAVLRTTGQILSGVADLRSHGCVENLGGLGVIMSTYELLGDMAPAEVDMHGSTAGNRDRAEYQAASVPVPIIHKDFQLSIRHLEASRRNGGTLQTDHATLAARTVTEKLESMLFTGAPEVVAAGGTIYGYTTFPQRITITTSADWGTTANIYSSVQAMITALITRNFMPPFMLYVNPTQMGEALAAQGVDTATTALSRLNAMYAGYLEGVKMSTALTAGNAVMAKLSPEVIDMAVGQDITTVEWNELGGMVGNFKVMACATFRPKASADTTPRCGIVHHSGI